MPRLFALLILLGLLSNASHADGPQDNLPDNVRRIPKLGIEVPAEQRAELEQELRRLQAAIELLGTLVPGGREWLRAGLVLRRGAGGGDAEQTAFFAAFPGEGGVEADSIDPRGGLALRVKGG